MEISVPFIYHQQTGDMSYESLLRVRSWNNIMCYMFYYDLMNPTRDEHYLHDHSINKIPMTAGALPSKCELSFNMSTSGDWIVGIKVIHTPFFRRCTKYTHLESEAISISWTIIMQFDLCQNKRSHQIFNFLPKYECISVHSIALKATRAERCNKDFYQLQQRAFISKGAESFSIFHWYSGFFVGHYRGTDSQNKVLGPFQCLFQPKWKCWMQCWMGNGNLLTIIRKIVSWCLCCNCMITPPTPN